MREYKFPSSTPNGIQYNAGGLPFYRHGGGGLPGGVSSPLPSSNSAIKYLVVLDETKPRNLILVAKAGEYIEAYKSLDALSTIEGLNSLDRYTSPNFPKLTGATLTVSKDLTYSDGWQESPFLFLVRPIVTGGEISKATLERIVNDTTLDGDLTTIE